MTYVLDSNIIIHAIQRDDPTKATIAKDLLDHFVKAGGSTPRQVLGEILNVGHKRGRPMLDIARTAVRLMEGSLAVIDVDGPALWSASELAQRYKLQFFDAVICTVAKASGASILFSEDMHDGLRVGSLTIANPYSPGNADLVSDALAR